MLTLSGEVLLVFVLYFHSMLVFNWHGKYKTYFHHPGGTNTSLPMVLDILYGVMSKSQAMALTIIGLKIRELPFSTLST